MKYLFKFLSIFSLIYGLIMFFTNITKTFFLIWMCCALVFYLIYVLYEKNIIKKIPNQIRKLILIISIVGIVIISLCLFEIIKNFNNKPKDNLDYIIVLGALVTKDGPALSTIYRLDEAIDYLNKNENTICILTGGKGKNEPDAESRIMADYLIKHNINENRLIIEDKSTKTIENLENSKQYIDIENNSIGIVTNNFHVARALLLAHKVGYKNVYGMPCYSLPINLISTCLRECAGIIFYSVFN